MSHQDISVAGATVGTMAPSHAKTRTPGLGTAWAVMIGTGGISVTYNVVYATHSGRLEVALALLLGFAPAFVSACLSHVAAVLDAPRLYKAAVVVVMLAGMVLSANATASVVAPALPGWKGWLFGGLLDASALLALWAIFNARQRKNEAQAAADATLAEARAAIAAATEAARERDRLASELAELREQSAADLAAMRAELEALRTRSSTRRPARSSGRKRARSSAPASARSSPPERAAGDDTQEVSTEARALAILAKHPDISGSELGRRLGMTDRYGRDLIKVLAPANAPPDMADSGEG